MIPIYRFGSITINEARLCAGLSMSQAIELCDISQSTWYRWCKEGAPSWAHRLLECYAGHLDHLGWRGWQIQSGRLFTYDLSYRYSWKPSDLLIHAANLTTIVLPTNIGIAVNHGPGGNPAMARSRPYSR